MLIIAYTKMEKKGISFAPFGMKRKQEKHHFSKKERRVGRPEKTGRKNQCHRGRRGNFREGKQTKNKGDCIAISLRIGFIKPPGSTWWSEQHRR